MSNSPSHINTNTSFGITENSPLYNYDQRHNTNIAILGGGAIVKESELFLNLKVEHPFPLTSMANLASTF
jgi:hypothetical protein